MIRLWCVALVAVVAVVSCDSVPLTSPTGSTISISIDRSVLPLNGQATVRAVVIESSGTPVHNGTTVNFTASIGTVNPPTAETVNGVATATFLAGTMSGEGVIHAFSGGIRTGSGNASSGGAAVTVGAAAARGMSVSATPSSVSQGGGTVAISALVMDEANNPLPGVQVLFTTSSGSLSSTNSLSDANGIARVQLTTSQTATVTATAGPAKGEFQVQVSTAPTVTIDAPAAGTTGVPVAITVSTSSGNTSAPRQIQTLDVDFGDGSVETRSNVTGSVAFTHVYREARGYTITARAIDVGGNTGLASRAIVVSRATPTATIAGPATVSLAAPSNGVAGFTVTAAPATGGPPITSVVVRLADGTVIYSGTAGGAFTYQFTSTGAKAVTLTVTDAGGGVGIGSTIVSVTP